MTKEQASKGLLNKPMHLLSLLFHHIVIENTFVYVTLSNKW